MRGKRILGLAVGVVAASILLTACGGGDSSSSDGKEELTIGFTTITLDDRFFVRLNEGAEKAAKEEGVEIILQNPNGDPTKQANQIENFVQQGVDAIIVDPIDPNAVVPSLERARDADIPVVAVDEVLEGDDLIDASAGHDNREVGRKLGEALVAQIEADDSEARVGIIQTFDAPIENTRVEGFREAVEDNPNIEVVGRVDAQFDLERANVGAENLITSDPDLNWFYTTGGNNGIGALSAIRSQGKDDDIRMVGWDLSEQLIAAIKDGIYIEAAEQDADAMGSAAVDAAVKLARGEDVPRLNTVPVTYVTKENVDKVNVDE